MSRIIIFSLFITCLLWNRQVIAQTSFSDIKPEEFVNGKVRIKFKEGKLPNGSNLRVAPSEEDVKSLGLESLDKVSQKISIHSIKRVFPFSKKHEARHRKHGLHLWYEVEFDTASNPLDIVEQYKGVAELEIVKPVLRKERIDKDSKPVVFNKSNFRKTATNQTVEEDSVVFDDPMLADQWHYDNNTHFGDVGHDIDLFEAWKTTSGSNDIIVAVVDQGVDAYHEDLKDNMWRNEAEIHGEEGVDDDGNGYIDDFHGWNFVMQGVVVAGDHGTHVAGTVGAVGNNGIGVAGVAGGDGSGNGVKLISCQVFDSRSRNGANFAEAIVYGADHGAVISQNSWGYNQSDYYEPEVLDAIRYFIEEAGQYEGSPMKGGILFFAAGNEGIEANRYPGAFEEVVAVSAMGPEGLPSVYTNYGEWVDIAAPGGDSFSYGENFGILSTITGDNYGYMDGTSMACPHVSGVAALVISKFGGEDFTNEDLKRIILNSVSRFRFIHENKYGKGYLNAAKALVDDNRIPPNAIEDLAAKEVFHNEVRLQWTVPDDEDGKEPSYYHVSIAETEITAQNFDSNALFQFENNEGVGETFEMSIGGLRKEKKYWFAIKSFDQFDNVSEISNVLEIKTSKEPHFMESTRTIDVVIDVKDNPTKDIPLTFSNIGEGIVYWNTSISNEDYILGLPDDKESTDVTLESAESNLASASTLSVNTDTLGASVKVVDSEIMNNSEVMPHLRHWEKDKTAFIAGMSYENNTPPAIFAGTGNPNIGFMLATRFHVPYEYSFNLTHIETVLFPEVNDKPIYIEIKKGGRDNLLESETVYTQEYYPDTVNQLKYYRIPIYRPQKFEHNETFWVVMHFPKEMLWAQTLQFGDIPLFNHFIMSRDGGRSYRDLNDGSLGTRPLIPMLSALSTGNDGSYVFLDPSEGEIKNGTPQEVKATIDASFLTNGHHLASLGIITNDIHKPVVNIEVKVFVEGQNPELDLNKVHELKAFVGEENKLELDIQNIGLGELEIYGASSEIGDLSLALGDDIDTLRYAPAVNGVIPLTFTTTEKGLVNTSIILDTNIGEIELKAKFIIEEAPVLAVSIDKSDIDVEYGSEVKLNLTLENTGKGANLEYDLEHFNIFRKQAGRLPQKLEYNIYSIGKEDNHSSSNEWIDISKYGTPLELRGYVRVPLGMKFPYFDELIESVSLDTWGNVWLNSEGILQALSLDGFRLNASTAMYHQFGDKTVITMNPQILSSGLHGDEGNVEYQFVLFRDGTIEYRYHNMDDILSSMDYDIIARSSQFDSLIYKDLEEVEKRVENGTVVRFEPKETVSMLSDAWPASGSIFTGSSENISLTINPEAVGFVAGEYRDTVFVYSNTMTEVDSIPLTIRVHGAPEIEVKTDTLFFDIVNIGQSGTGYIEVENIGADETALTSLQSASAEFDLDISLPIAIKGKSSIQLPVQFIPSSNDSITSSVQLSFETGETVDVLVIGKGKYSPEYTTTLPSDEKITASLIAGEYTNKPFTVTNTSNEADLTFIFKNDLFSLVHSDNDLVTEELDSISSDYGYTWEIADSLSASRKWKDITDYAETHNLEGNGIEAIELPFSFPFYGNLYDTIWLSENGFVSVIKPDANDIDYLATFEKEDGVRGMIAPFWAPLAPSIDSQGGIKVVIEENRAYFQWNNFTYSGESDQAHITFQLELVNDGSIYFHYKRVKNWSHVFNYGIESPDEEDVLEDYNTWIVDWALFDDNSTIAIAPPTKGLIKKGESKDFELKLSADNIYLPGTYQDTVILYTNSFKQPVLEIPVEVEVTGTPILQADDTLQWENMVFTEEMKLRQRLMFTNEGYDVLEVSNISYANLEGLDIYDMDGNKYTKSSSGRLLSPISIKPWHTASIEVEIPVSSMQNIEGSIILEGNFEVQTVEVVAEIVESPVLDWTGTNQHFQMNSTEKETYTFTIENKGETKLTYKLEPAVIPSIDNEEGELHISDEIGKIILENPVTVDSLALEYKEKSDGFYVGLISPSNLSFANKYTAPEGGFFLTHVKSYLFLNTINGYVRIMIYTDGENPQDGEKLYEQKFLVEEGVDEEWVYFPFEKPFVIPEGQKFWVIVDLPQPINYKAKYIGFDIVEDDSDILNRTASGLNQGLEETLWNLNDTPDQFTSDYAWKIRPLTAAGEDSWVELDIYEGELRQNESVEITATIAPDKIGSGTHKGKLILTSNDINYLTDEIDLTIDVNGAPEFVYYPNMYKDTVRIVETEETVLSYLIEDPEGEQITITSDYASSDSIYTEFKQTGDKTAQLKIKTDYDSKGVYTYPVQVEDTAGNIIQDSVIIEVLDKNRPPVFNTEYEVIYLNLADSTSSFVIDPMDLFTDLDEDSLQVYVGNFNPDIVDMALGMEYIDLHPLKEGTAELIFASDDQREDGFVIQYVYVVVIDDPSAVKSSVNAYGVSDELLEELANSEENAILYPSPVTNHSASLLYTLEDDAEVTIELYNSNGQLKSVFEYNNVEQGIHKQPLDLQELSNGLYYCTLKVNHKVTSTFKVLIL